MTTSEPKVIYEDKDFLVLSKPAGLLMHPFRVGTDEGKVVVRESTLTNWLTSHYPETKIVGDNPEMRPGLVHRLDRDTSGVLIVARNQEAFHYFKSLFQNGGIRKTYLALVLGVPKNEEGRIEKPISLKPGTTKRTVHAGKMTKDAITEYEVVETFSRGQNAFALLKVRPLTGRTHQIRVHLASIDHPILGDEMYGSGKRREEKSVKVGRLMLHAESIAFKTSSGEDFVAEVPMPPDFDETIKLLRTSS